MKIDTIIYLFLHPRRLVLLLLSYSAGLWPDVIFLKLKFFFSLGYNLNLKSPQTFNEKLQWLKLYNRKPNYTAMVDKIAAKDYVSNIIGSDYIIPTIATYDSVDQIDWSSLPNRFVIKCSHDSGGIVICKDKSKLRIEDAIKKLEKALHRDYYARNREWPYKNVKRRLLCEEYMEDESGFELKDYKIFCFDGEPKFLFVATGRQQHDTRFDFYDLDFNHLPVLNGHPNADTWPTKPQNFDEMLDVAAKLSKGIPHVRVDLYNINGRIYFGELTFFHWSGFVPFEPEEWDYQFGTLIRLSNS